MRFLWKRISLEAAHEADVVVEFKAEAITFLECFNWWGAVDHVAAARKERTDLDDYADKVNKNFKRP